VRVEGWEVGVKEAVPEALARRLFELVDFIVRARDQDPWRKLYKEGRIDPVIIRRKKEYLTIFLLLTAHSNCFYP
jgi:hypothetical protein